MTCLAGKWNPHTKKLQNKILSHPHKKKTKPSQTKSTDQQERPQEKNLKECTQIRASRKRICSDCSPQRSRIHNQYKTKAAEEGKKKETNQQEKDKTELKLTSHGGLLVDGTWCNKRGIKQRRASERQSVRKCREGRSCVAVPPSPSPYPSGGLSPPSGRWHYTHVYRYDPMNIGSIHRFLGFSSNGSTASMTSGCVCILIFGMPFFIQRFLFDFPADRCLSRRPLAPLSLAPSLSTRYISRESGL